MNTEAAVYKYLKRKLPQVDWCRVEAWVGAGIPDVNGAFLWPPEGQQEGFEVWCELKVCKTKNYKTNDLWRPAQIAFQTRRSIVSGAIWNLVSHPRAEVLYIYSGAKVAQLSTDSTGSTEPDLILKFNEPWTAALGLFASRQVRQIPQTDSVKSKHDQMLRPSTGSKDPGAAAIDPLGR